MSERHPVAAFVPETLFFLSDYGSEDEFVGVVHAVVLAASPGVAIVDLTHQIAAFDIRAGALALVRAAPYLGPGVVLAVVDPGVGSVRRGVCLEVTSPGPGPAFFVGPDNGLLVAAAELVGGGSISGAVALAAPPGAVPGQARTFDGRDLFAPAAAALCRGVPIGDLGPAVDPDSLVRLALPTVAHGVPADGGGFLAAEVVWVDRFGNLQLAATVVDAQKAQVPGLKNVIGPDRRPAPLTRTAPLTLTCHARTHTLRTVGTFADLARGELGLLLDANGHLAVVAGQASAAGMLSTGTGDTLTLTW